MHLTWGIAYSLSVGCVSMFQKTKQKQKTTKLTMEAIA
jgi:hypothetical protein